MSKIIDFNERLKHRRFEQELESGDHDYIAHFPHDENVSWDFLEGREGYLTTGFDDKGVYQLLFVPEPFDGHVLVVAEKMDFLPQDN